MGKSCAKKMAGRWFQPIWKILVKFWNLPQCSGVKIKNIWVATTKMVHLKISPLKKWDSEFGFPIILRCCHHPAAPRRGTAGVFSPVQSLLRTTARAVAANASKGPGAQKKTRFPTMEAHMELQDVDVFKKKLNPNDLNFIWIWIAILGALPKHILIGFLSSKWIHHGLSMPNI